MRRTRHEHAYTTVRREVGFTVPYADFKRALESLLGRVDVHVLGELARETPERARERLGAMVGLSGFALFQRIEHGAALSAVSGREAPAATYVVGNVLGVLDAMRVEPAVGLYLPSRLHVFSDKGGGVTVTYDLPSSTLAQFRSPPLEKVAASLDVRVQKLVDVAAALAAKTSARRERPALAHAEPPHR